MFQYHKQKRGREWKGNKETTDGIRKKYEREGKNKGR
jgi:hypothetical protein